MNQRIPENFEREMYIRGQIKKEVSNFFIPKPKELHKIGNVRLKATPIVYKKQKNKSVLVSCSFS
jgi:hypothetical protein